MKLAFNFFVLIVSSFSMRIENQNNESLRRIIGGTEAKAGQFPYQVYLVIQYKIADQVPEYTICSGSLISRQTVLTAAHCLRNAEQVFVVIGKNDVEIIGKLDELKKVSTSQFKLHENFTYAEELKLIKNDIALIKLPSDVELNEKVATVSLPENDDDSLVGEIATSSGWGIQVDGDYETISKTLKFVENQIISTDECIDAYETKFKSNKDLDILDQICLSTTGKKSACNGDSGSPLTIKRNNRVVQVGISSFGANKCEIEAPAMYERVSKHLSWIKQNMYK